MRAERAVQPFDPAKERYVALATYRRDGREVRTPVWVVRDGDRYYVFTARGTGKVKRIRATGRFRMAPCDARGRLRSGAGWLAGTGRVLDDAAQLAALYPLFRAKYGWQMRLVDWSSRLTRRYEQRVMLELEPEQGVLKPEPGAAS